VGSRSQRRTSSSSSSIVLQCCASLVTGEEIMRVKQQTKGSTQERAKASHWRHFYSVYGTQKYRTGFFLHTLRALHLTASQSKRHGWTTSHQSLVAVPSGSGTPAGHGSSAQLSPRGPRAQMRSCTVRGSCSRRVPHRSGLASHL
jgi:hypothetical protein